jgi:hypothetical protein
MSGETLGLGDQKALIDRTVMVNPPDPKNRRSRLDPSRPQWDDIAALSQVYPEERGGLAVLAGRYLRMALTQEERFLQAVRECKRSGGRRSEKYAIMAAAARLVDAMLAGAGTSEENPEEVAAAWAGQGWASLHGAIWAAEDDKLTHEDDNALTLRVLPWALREYGACAPGDYSDMFGKPKPIVYLPEENGGEGGVWFSVPYLAQAWENHRRAALEARTESSAALSQQLKTLGWKNTRQFHRSSPKPKYTAVPADRVRALVERAFSEGEGAGQRTEQLGLLE